MNVAGTVQRTTAIVLWGLVILIGAALVAPDETFGQPTHRAALLVDFGANGTEASCVSFSENEISGAELLRRAGLSVVFSGFGGLGSGVCQIDGEGCSDPGNCFCQCTGANCRYWSYWVLEGGTWRYQQVGASGRDVVNGQVHAWVWGNGRTPPDPAAFGDVCPITLPATPRATQAPPRQSGPEPRSVAPTDQPRAGQGVEPPPTESAARDATVQPTRRSTEDVRGSIGTPRPRREANVTSGDAGDGSGGVPAGLIAFGSIAGALVLAIGGLALWRRIVG